MKTQIISDKLLFIHELHTIRYQKSNNYLNYPLSSAVNLKLIVKNRCVRHLPKTSQYFTKSEVDKPAHHKIKCLKTPTLIEEKHSKLFLNELINKTSNKFLSASAVLSIYYFLIFHLFYCRIFISKIIDVINISF